MALSFLDRVVGFLARPAETFRAVRDETVTDAAIYFLLLLVVQAVLAGLMVYLGLAVMDGSGLGIDTGPDAGIWSFVWALIFTYIWGIFTLVVWSSCRSARRHSADGETSPTRSRRPSTPRRRTC